MRQAILAALHQALPARLATRLALVGARPIAALRLRPTNNAVASGAHTASVFFSTDHTLAAALDQAWRAVFRTRQAIVQAGTFATLGIRLAQNGTLAIWAHAASALRITELALATTFDEAICAILGATVTFR